MCLTLPRQLSNAFLCDVRTYDVHDNRCVDNEGESELDRLAIECLQSGTARVVTLQQENAVAALAFPVFRNETIVSIVVLATTAVDQTPGVFEVWSPVGIYEEVALSSGYYGHLARFQNVSSFIRFEKGSGLPGQVWNSLRSIIHNDLANHSGFLRAAGASAGTLETAIGIPVAGENYVASVLLISSNVAPMARGFEIWRADADGGYTLESASYPDPQIELAIGTSMPANSGIPALADEHNGATVTENPTILRSGRQFDEDATPIQGCLAIPFYESDAITSVTVLLF
ncbi:hypothetical protein RMSM_07157 [Rhodopirellula maiorica SM1]|uniref:GAF domain-containing protein n=1 Tax=Rhodopirellula maiorica SM1 TaxID=1265738 RepID=M5RKN3_9BACT|nr:GAF domain-containing protein [Rhodopirellula maiorica]EMI15927.1 hypothetical protein RMSM_07157 [Rhodopirellula maiorica SM1]